jgi:hypothetical protein
MFEVRSVRVPPGCTCVYDEADWQDSLVVIERGAIELEGPGGNLHHFARGDVLWLAGLSLRAVRNTGGEPALLLAVARRR